MKWHKSYKEQSKSNVLKIIFYGMTHSLIGELLSIFLKYSTTNKIGSRKYTSITFQEYAHLVSHTIYIQENTRLESGTSVARPSSKVWGRSPCPAPSLANGRLIEGNGIS